MAGGAVAVTAVALRLWEPAAALPGEIAQAAEPEPLAIDRSQDEMQGVIDDLEAEEQADPSTVELPPGALDGVAPEPTDPSVLVDTDGDGVVMPPIPEPPAIVTGPPAGATPDPAPDATAPPTEEQEALAEKLASVDLSALEPGDEVTELRTVDSQTFVEEGGKLRTQLSTEPIFVETADGEMEEPEPSPVVDATEDRWEPEVGSEGTSFAPQANDEVLSTVDFGEGRSISWSLKGAFPRLGLPDGDDLRYANVFPGVDLRMTASALGVKETLVLHDATAPTVYEFPLDLTGLSATLASPYSAVVLADSSTGEQVGVIPAGWAQDSYEGRDIALMDRVPVRYELLEADGGVVLKVTVDEAWLDDPARVFPVLVDPTPTKDLPAADSYTNSAVPFANFGGAPELIVGGNNANRHTMFMRWNLDLLSTSIIWEAQYGTFNHYSYTCNVEDTWFGLYRITDYWDPYAVNYDNSPPYWDLVGSRRFAHGGPTSACSEPAFEYFDITEAARHWADGSWQNWGITGRVNGDDSEYETDDYSASVKQFASSERNGQLLDVVWSPYRVAYGLGAVQAPTYVTPGWMDVTITNKTIYNWNATGANPFYLTYHVYHSNGSTPVQRPDGSYMYDVHRTPLTRDVGLSTGTSLTLRAQVNAFAPVGPGNYVIKWDIVRDGVTFFSWEGNDPDLWPMEVPIPVPNVPPHIEQASPAGPTDMRSPTLRVTAGDRDNWPNVGMWYRFTICEDVAMTVGCVRSIAEPHFHQADSWRPTHLLWGKTYYWTVTVSDGNAETALPWKLPVTPTVGQPRVARHFGSDPYAPLHGGVNPSIGNYVTRYTDVSVAGAGLPIEWTRTYNSMDDRVGAFGPGWTTFLEMKATRDGVGKLLIRFPDGRHERYGQNGDGSWQAGPGNTSVLRGLDGGWELQRPDHMSYVFNSDGNLIQVRDGWGHTLSLTWNAGRVELITSQPSNRSLHLTWGTLGPNGVSVVTSARTDDVTVEGSIREPEWTYTYDGTGRLASSCAPQAAPNCTTYSYYTSGQGSTGRLQRVVNPEGNDAVQLGYQPDGSVEWIENGTNDRWTFSDQDDQAEGTYYPIDGWRARWADLPSGETTVDVTDGVHVPSEGVQAVVVDLEVAAASGPGWIQAYPSGTPEPQPYVSTMDFAAGIPRSTLATIPVGADGKIALSNHGPAVGSIVDVVGWYGKAGVVPLDPDERGSVFVPLEPTRILDSRTSWQGPLGAGESNRRDVQVTGVGGVPSEGVTAVVYNLEMVGASGFTWLTAYPKGHTSIDISTGVTVGGQVDNLHITKVGDGGKINLFNANGSVHVLVDVVGYFADPNLHEGSVYRPVTNYRLVNTSDPNSYMPTPWPENGTRSVLAAGQGPIPQHGVTAVVGDVQAMWPPRTSLMYMRPSGPSNGQYVTTYMPQAGQAVGNHYYTGLGENGAFDLTSGVNTNVAIEVAGYFTPVPRTVIAEDLAGGKMEYRFDELGRLTGMVNQDGYKTAHSYNARGLLETTSDDSGARNTYLYDDKGHVVADVIQELDGWGNQTWRAASYYGYVNDPANPTVDGKLQWVADRRSSGIEDPNFRTTYTYNSLGQPVSVKGPPRPGLPGGAGVTNTYTTAATPAVGGAGGTAPPGLLASSTDAGGLTTSYGYDTKGDLREVTHPGGRRDVYSYDELGRVVSQTLHSAAFPDGVTTTRVYDDQSRITRETGPVTTSPVAGNVQARTRTIFTPNGLPGRVTIDDAITGAGGRWVEFTYDDADRVETTSDNAGRTTAKTYDSRGNLRTETSVDGLTLEHTYNARSLRIATTAKNIVDDPIGAPSVRRDMLVGWFGYDAAGRQVWSVDPTARVTRQTWRADDQPELSYAANIRNTGPDTGLPASGTRSVLNGAALPDQVGNPLETFNSTDVNYTDEFAGSALGAGWISTGGWTVGGGEVRSTAAALARRTGAADGSAGVIAGAATSTNVVFRASDNNNFHRATYSSYFTGAVVAIDRVVGGVPTNIGLTVLAAPPKEGDRLEAVFVGPRMWVLLNGNPVLTATDATNREATGVGVSAGGAGQEAGSFRFDAYRRTVNTFDNYGYLTSSVVDPSGANQRTSFRLDSAGRPVEVTRSLGVASPAVSQVARVGFDAAGHMDWTEQVVEGGVARTDLVVDDRGLTTAVVSPEGSRVDFAYDEVGQVRSVTEPSRTVERFGQPAAPGTRPTTSFAYTVFGERYLTRDPTGAQVLDWIDDRGFPVATSYPAYTPPGGTPQARTSFATFDAVGRTTSSTDVTGQRTDLTLNTLGLLVETKDPAANGQARGTWRTRYDDAGRPVEQIDATGAVVRPRWNDLDQLVGVEEIVRQPTLTSNVSGFTTGNGGNVLRARTPVGVTATSEYDVAGRLTRTLDAAGNATTFSYDTLSQLENVTGPDNRSTRSTYNLAGDKVRDSFYGPTGALLGSTTSIFDKDHQVLETRSPNGVAGNYGTTFDYNDAGQLTTRTTPVASGQAIVESFGYDELGRATRYTDGNNNASWQTYNAMGLPEDGIAAAAGGQTSEADRRWRSAYDLAGRPVTETAPGGITTSTTYDELGRVKQQSATGGSAATDTRTYHYDLLGRVTQAAVPAGSQTFTYDDRSLLLSSNGISGNSSFVYDAGGRVTRRTDGSGVSDFTYDNRGLPDTMTSSLSGTVSYDFDTVGRPTLVDYGTTERTFTYDPWGRTDLDQLKTGATTLYAADYGYDLDGNITTKATSGPGVPATGANTYTYDRSSRVTSWTGPGRPTETYTWDGASNRTQAGSTTAAYDEQNRLINTTSADGQTTYGWNPNGTLNQQTTTLTQRRVSLVVANPASLTAAETALRDHYGAAGAAVAILDDNAAAPTTGVDVVIVAPTVDNAAVADKYKALAVPVVNLASGTWQNSGLTNAAATNGSGTAANPATPIHPIAAGKTANTTVLTSSDTLNRTTAASLGAGATRVWTTTATSTDTVVAAYDTAAATPGGAAPARRVTVGYSAGAIGKLNADGWAILDAAIGWADDNPLASGTTSFKYDGFEQLREATTAAGSTTYDYDPLGRRLNSPTGTLTYAGAAIRPATDGASRYQPGPIGVIGIDDTTTGGGTWAHTDGHTDVVGNFTNGATSLAGAQTFTPWGQPLGRTGAALPLGYQSERQDLPGGLIGMGVREYNPATGTFTARDPANDPNVPNGYSYTSANPLGYTDPTGMLKTCPPNCPQTLIWAMRILAGGGVGSSGGAKVLGKAATAGVVIGDALIGLLVLCNIFVDQCIHLLEQAFQRDILTGEELEEYREAHTAPREIEILDNHYEPVPERGHQPCELKQLKPGSKPCSGDSGGSDPDRTPNCGTTRTCGTKPRPKPKPAWEPRTVPEVPPTDPSDLMEEIMNGGSAADESCTDRWWGFLDTGCASVDRPDTVPIDITINWPEWTPAEIIKALEPIDDPPPGSPEPLETGDTDEGVLVEEGQCGWSDSEGEVGTGEWADSVYDCLAQSPNRADHERYLDELRAAMERPFVTDPDLNDLLDDLYRPGAQVGSGSTAAAVRYEQDTGQLVGGRSHTQKAQDYLTALERWVVNHPEASPNDLAAAENVIRDLRNSLGL